MIKLANCKLGKHGNVIARNEDIESFAYRQLREYQHGYFDTPHKLDVDDFLESYLDIHPEFKTLSGNGTVLGQTIIQGGKILTLLDGVIRQTLVKRGDVIIDERACGNEGRLAFTEVHESWHRQEGMDLDEETLSSVTGFSDTNKTYGIASADGQMSALDWEEYHANMYAKFILMPKKFVVELFTTYRKDKFPTRKITKAHAKRAWAIIIEVADYLGVSHTAMAYRVKELGLISEEVFDAMELKQYAT